MSNHYLSKMRIGKASLTADRTYSFGRSHTLLLICTMMLFVSRISAYAIPFSEESCTYANVTDECSVTCDTIKPVWHASPTAKSTTIVILEPLAISAVINQDSSNIVLACPDDVDGQIFLDITGGTEPYSYQYTVNGGAMVFSGLGNEIDTLGVGTYSITVVDDNGCDADVLTVSVSAQSSCSPDPFVQDDLAAVDEDMSLTVDVLSNDDFGTDGPGTTPLSISLTPADGIAIVNENNTPNDPTDDFIDYLPNPNFYGTDSLHYQICDANGDCAEASLIITVNPVDEDVVAANPSVNTQVNTPVGVTVLSLSQVPDGLASMTILMGPTHGTASINDNGTPTDPSDDFVEYQPDNGFMGDDSVEYELCDMDGDCATGTISLKVLEFSPMDCNNPIVGKDAIVDMLAAGTLCALCQQPNVEEVVDGDLSNFVTFDASIVITGLTPLISIKDIGQMYPAGQRTGFVVQAAGGILNQAVLDLVTIRTYLNNQIQETVVASAPAFSVTLLPGAGDKKRLSIITTLPFDEVELLLNASLTNISGLRLYHAFTENATGCDFDCDIPLVNPAYSSSVNAALTGISNCIPATGCGVSDEAFVTDPDLSNYAAIDFGILGLNETATLSVLAGSTLAAGTEAGFALQLEGTPDILGSNVLANIQLHTYLGGIPQESIDAVSLQTAVDFSETDNLTRLAFKTTLAFDEVQIAINELLSVGAVYRIYYALIRPDSDNDSIADCADKCVGNDLLDTDGDGTPDVCDTPPCELYAGLDVQNCTDGSTAQLGAADPGQSWTAASGNPAPTTIDNNGNVSGLSTAGAYRFILSEGSCTDTVTIVHTQSNLDAACNNPITGPDVIITDPAGNCLLCANGNIIIDDSLNNFVSLNASTTISTPTTLIAVRDTANVYTAGSRTGFVIEAEGGLLDLTVMNNLEIRTYLDGSLQETATVNDDLARLGVLPGRDNRQRIGFVTTLDFDEVALVATSSLLGINEFRIFFAFEEPVSCPLQDGTECIEALTQDNELCPQIVYERSGLDGVTCAGCFVDSLSHVIDGELSNAARISLVSSSAATGSISIGLQQTIPAGYEAGFVIGDGIDLASANVLDALRLQTYAAGVLQEEYFANDPLLELIVLGNVENQVLLSFRNTVAFDEIRLSLLELTGVLSDIDVYHAFVRSDADNDGVPDCLDQCCGGDDSIDTNGDGRPDNCDSVPDAQDDLLALNEDNIIGIDVLANDDFGADGPAVGPLQIVTHAANGTASVNDNGTPDDPTDDIILYIPNPDYNGQDSLTYVICDTSNDCDTATVVLVVNPIDDPVVAVDDTVSVDEDMFVTFNPVTNDSLPDGGMGTVTVTTDPAHGSYTIDDNGTPDDPTDDTITYLPAPDYNGTDTLSYQVCDVDGDCDTAQVVITINPVEDTVLALDDMVSTDEDMSVVVSPTANDTIPAGGAGTISVLSDPVNGTYTINDGGTPNDPGDDTILYVPNPNFNGTDSLTYQVCDVNGDCDNAQITFTVNPVNDPVTAVDDMVATNLNQPLLLSPAANDTLPDGGNGTLTIISGPDNGNFVFSDGGTPNDPTDDMIEYTPNLDFVGTDLITYQICDIDGDCDQADIVIEVLNPVIDCNNPITGIGVTIDKISTGLACVDCGTDTLDHLIDGDLSNYIEVNTSSALPTTSLVAVNDMLQVYPAGRRVGFVIESPNEQIDGSAVSTFEIRTFLNNVPQDTAMVPLDPRSQIGAGIGAQKRVSFVTDMPFDEVELLSTAPASMDTILRIYYAFEEPAEGCDYACEEFIIAPVYSSSINAARTLCTDTLTCDILDAVNLVDSDTSNYATISFDTITMETSASISVAIGETILAGSETGFALEQTGTMGILPPVSISQLIITTYMGGVMQESVSAASATSGITGANDGSNKTFLSITSTLDFDEIQLSVTETSSVDAEYFVYYAFVRIDTDGDGYPDCIDKCVGDDALDEDGDGIPDACDLPLCTVVAGMNESVCTDVNTAQLMAAGPGETWAALSSNPSPATIDGSGAVSGLSAEGIYQFVLSNGSCSDTVALTYQQSALAAFCNDPLAGDDVVIDTDNPTGGVCLSCDATDANNVRDGNLGNFMSYDATLPVLFSTGIISVRDTSQTYSAGERTGYVIEAVGGVLDATVLEFLEIRTFLNGSPQEIANAANGLLQAVAIPGPANQSRLSFLSSQEFDEVELVVLTALGTVSSLNIYYAFTEPAGGCPDFSLQTCIQSLLATGPNVTGIDFARTGFSGSSCSECEILDISNLVDQDTTNVTQVKLSLGLGAIGSLGVKTVETIEPGYIVGFALQELDALLSTGVLDAMTLTTYLNGVEQESVVGSSSAAMVASMDPVANVGMLAFANTLPFNSLQFSVEGILGGLSVVDVLQALVLSDIDGDSVPDCIDKCCSGDDLLDDDGNGLPNGCGLLMLALPDVLIMNEGSDAVIDVLANDDFGPNGPGGDSIEIITNPLGGIATVNNAGTPTDPTDDWIDYSPAEGFFGADVITYQITDGLGNTAQAVVAVTVTPIFVRLNPIVLLQGALLDNVSLNGVMRDDLRSEGLIPTLEPYSALNNFLHAGGGGGSLIPDVGTVLADLGVNSVSDWIFVELRDPNDPTVVVATRSGLLQRDGDITDVNGLAALLFSQTEAGSFYVAVRHRNHLGVMTANPIELSALGTTVDFTDINIDLYNTSPLFDGFEQKEVDGKFALWAGNTDAGNTVVFSGEDNDLDPIFNIIDQAPGNFLRSQSYILEEYSLGDVNLDGKTIFDGENNDVDPIFNNVDGHPRNFLRSQSFIIIEQLPENQ